MGFRKWQGLGSKRELLFGGRVPRESFDALDEFFRVKLNVLFHSELSFYGYNTNPMSNA